MQRVQRRHVPLVAEEDFDNVWYRAKYIAEAHKAEKALRKYISTDHRLYEQHAEQFYAQGVVTEEQAAEARDAIEESIAAVLREQACQEYNMFGVKRTEVIRNDEKIAQVYLPYSQKALKDAQIRAASLRRKRRGMEKKPSEKTAFSPTRLLKKGLSSTKVAMQKISPKRSFRKVSVSPSQMVTCTLPIA